MYSLAVDTLEVVCRGVPDINAGISFPELKIEIDTEHKSPFYNFSYVVLLHNEKICNIKYGERIKLRYAIREYSLITVLNPALYSQEIGNKIQRILHLLKLEFYKYKTLHIALDGHCLMEKQLLLKRNIELERKVKVQYAEVENEAKQSIIEIRLGSRFSNKFVVFYKKYQDVISKGKGYIIDYWLASGADLNLIPEFERVEVRLKKSELTNISTDLALLFSTNYLMSIFKSKTEKTLTYLNKRTKKLVGSVVNWNEYELIVLEPLNRPEPTEGQNVIKIVVKKLYQEYHRINYPPLRLSYMKLVNTYRLDDWFESKRDKWKK